MSPRAASCVTAPVSSSSTSEFERAVPISGAAQVPVFGGGLPILDTVADPCCITGWQKTLPQPCHRKSDLHTLRDGTRQESA